MIFSLWKKQKNPENRKVVIRGLISGLNISSEQKEMYFEALGVIGEEDLEKLFLSLTNFIETIELKRLEDIKKESFGVVAGMRKKEAKEKVEEMNSFSFLLHNL